MSASTSASECRLRAAGITIDHLVDWYGVDRVRELLDDLGRGVPIKKLAVAFRLRERRMRQIRERVCERVVEYHVHPEVAAVLEEADAEAVERAP